MLQWLALSRAAAQNTIQLGVYFTAGSRDADFYATFQACIGLILTLKSSRSGASQVRWSSFGGAGFRMSWIFILSRISWRLSWLIWDWYLPTGLNISESISKLVSTTTTGCQTSSSLTGIWWPVRLGLVRGDVLRKDQYRSICKGRISSKGRTAPPSDLCEAYRHRAAPCQKYNNSSKITKIGRFVAGNPEKY